MNDAISGGPRSGAELVVKTLEERGVRYVFGVPGAKIDSVYNALVDSTIQTVVCRHEQNAAFIAGGIGRMTGKAGVAIVTSGPGVSNLATGLATANSEGDPVVALGGAVATEESLKQIHQTMDSVSLCKPVTKFSAAVPSPAAVCEVVSNAFRAAESGRPGAAFVSLPKDIMLAPAQGKLIVPPSFAGQGAADKAALGEAARLLSAAANPVVLLGLLASKPANADAIREFVGKSDLPVVGTFQAAGAVGAHFMRNFGGRVGLIANQPADRLLESADVVITIGYDPVEYEPAQWNNGATRPIIHVDVMPADLDNCYSPAVELIGDIAGTLESLASILDRTQTSATSTSILNDIDEHRRALEREARGRNGQPVHPLRLVADIQPFLESDVTVCLDMGSFHIWLARHMYSFQARQLLMTDGQQTLGVALPWAIAASLVRPSEKVLSISGDGGFLFSAMELETAVRLKCNIVHMIWIDGTYDMVAIQEVQKYGRKSGVDLGPYDPVKYAEAFGATGFMINHSDDIVPVLKRAFDTQGPVIVGVRVDYSDNHKLFEMVNRDTFH
ncbi:acetolactate synthase AlsS [Paraburkholderia pallida]|uniref:Acetolactate synthase AlsS n=1 Tax=Paraburkholderia pallida TaxID=2547399 RepID=A0A4P7D8W9_9BURK|nr:acetolactate synthase AlsS [Paraburkholderia pallida]QBR03640.1 acetolactate synthase AlsS [Paraburkholderia pallida]